MLAFEAAKISDDLFHSLRTKNPRRYDLTRWGVAVAFDAVSRDDCPVATLVYIGHQEMTEESEYDVSEMPAAQDAIMICDETPPPLPPLDYDLE